MRPTQPNTTFPGGATEHNFGQAPDSYVPPADTQIPVPDRPTVNDPDGPGNATWNVPDNTAQVTWTLNPDGTLVVTTNEGYVFTDGTHSHDFGTAPDSYVCPPGTQPIYAEGDDVLNDCRPVPTNAPTSSGGPTASPQPTGTSGGPTNQQPTGNPGPVIIDVPAAPAINDPPGSGNATWVKPTDSDPRITWTLSEGDRRIVASLPDGYLFANGQPSIDFGIACDSEGEQVAVESSTRVGNPTPQPTGNGGEGVRISGGGGEALRLAGAGLALLALGGLVIVCRRKGAHENA
ncbi:MAG: hypothetical protein WBP12_00385 [Candidatus Saccharimonas sp.]